MADSFVVRKLRDIKHRGDNVRSNKLIRKLESKPVNEILKTGFIVQMPELWGTEKSVYEIMCSDSRFEPWLIIVPKFDISSGQIEDNVGDYYINECKNSKMIIARKDGKWSDIDLDSFDYIFYQRPYNYYLPEHLQSGQVTAHARVCYIPYAIEDIKNAGLFEDDFFRNVFLGFHESDDIADLLNSKYPSDNGKRFLSIGNPTQEKAMSLNKKCEYSKVMWAPRWSTDPVIGGSHFPDYHKQLSDFPWGDNKLVIRPHPLMWENFIRKNIITEDEKNIIIEDWKQKGIAIDDNTSIFDTFNDTDILISDRSSVMSIFIMTGKPVIYCPFGSDYFELFDKTVSGCYIANDWNELESTVRMLLSGEDPLREKRLGISNELNLKYNHSSEAIVEYIYTYSAKYEKKEVSEK